jgi:hypothetical protein
MTTTVNATSLGRGTAADSTIDEQLTKDTTPPVGTRQLVVVPQSNAKEPSEDQGGDLDFDWHKDESVVLQHQLAVAVYRNSDGGVVIRQERNWNEECDTCIVISPENVGNFIDRLSEVMGIPCFGGPEPSPPPVRKC